MKRTLIFQDNERVENTADLLTVAQKMYGDNPFETTVVVTDEKAPLLSGLFHRMVTLPEDSVNLCCLTIVCDALESLHKEYNFDSILIPATFYGKMLAPRLAMRLKSAIVADVTEVRRSGNDFEVIRPAYSGRLLAGIRCKRVGPVMMSIRPNTFSFQKSSNLPTKWVAYRGKFLKHNRIKCLKVKPKEEKVDIRESQILVSGGAGVHRNFNSLKRLAKQLGGQVSASRKIVDRGVAPRYIQVGQSGKKVSPKLYIALGVSGAIQHVEGLKNIETIISVNINKEAPLCALSDIVVEGDALSFIKKLIERIDKYKKEKEEERRHESHRF